MIFLCKWFLLKININFYNNNLFSLLYNLMAFLFLLKGVEYNIYLDIKNSIEMIIIMILWLFHIINNSSSNSICFFKVKQIDDIRCDRFGVNPMTVIVCIHPETSSNCLWWEIS